MCEILVSKIVVCAMPYVLVPVFLRWDVIDLDDCVPEIFVMGAFRGCLFCISVSIMFFCLRCRARPPKGVQCLPGHTLGTGRKCKPGPRPTPETRVPQHANFAGGSNPAWTQKWGDMGARKGSPASPPPQQKLPACGEAKAPPERPRTSQRQEIAPYGVRSATNPGDRAAWGRQKLSQDQRGMTPKGDRAGRDWPGKHPAGANGPKSSPRRRKPKIVPGPTRHDPKGRPRGPGATKNKTRRTRMVRKGRRAAEKQNNYAVRLARRIAQPGALSKIKSL